MSDSVKNNQIHKKKGVKLYGSNNIASKYIEQKWTDLQEENDKSYHHRKNYFCTFVLKYIQCNE